MLKRCLICAAGVLAVTMAGSATAAVIFEDDFESGLGNWTTTGSSPFVVNSTRNAVPLGGSMAAFQDSSADRMHHNIVADNGGVELNGPSTFSAWIYDPNGNTGTTSTRMFNEVRGYSGGTGLPNGGTAASGALAQLLAIGKYNTITVGSPFNVNKYQARVTFGTGAGWFNLDDVGSPDRSVGWHEFTIERLADGTTLRFYVDGVLGKTFTGASAQSWDTIVMGFGLGTTVTDSHTDGIKVTDTLIPEPGGIALLALGALSVLRPRRRA